MDNSKVILVAPLDWGLGHASRCIPLIRSFLNQQHQVIIATSGKQEALLLKEFPHQEFIHLPGYNIEYPKNGSMSVKMMWQLPKIKKAIEAEHEWLEETLKRYEIDEVVSDNRYGLWNHKVHSVLVTHQLFIKAPTGEWLLEKMLNSYLARFNEVWIPDVEQSNNLSGDLSHKKPLPDHYQFIGLLSRFSNQNITLSILGNKKMFREVNKGKNNCHPEFNRRIANYEFDFIVILSGPEPQRTIFEKLVLEQIKGTTLKGILVRGLPGSCHSEFIEEDKKTLRHLEKLDAGLVQCDKKNTSPVTPPLNNDQLLIFNHLETSDFLNYLQKSKLVISRSGYSTIMDLAVLGKQAILVPTPGQTEQEYLAKYHQQQGHYLAQSQSEFNLKKGLEEVVDYKGIQFKN